ncbi:MAG: Mini-ribonuclease 3 [Blautia stercoris]|uniref:Mini-ribonuclease 3 n=1 Tax=Blautia stercoris TaxID=871664 RepID=UPI0039F9534A
MEASLSYLKELFALGNTDIKTYSPLTLAYIGDAVYEIVIRTILVEKGNAQVNKLHQRASKLVKASAQSEIIEKLKEDLTEEELVVYKRGRNAKSYTMAKNATMSDYRRATGFEALMGYLYLTEQWERMLQLIKKGIEKGETDGREVPGK